MNLTWRFIIFYKQTLILIIMKKLFLTLALLGGVIFSCLAQTTTTSTKQESKFSIGVDAGLPTGTAADVYNFAIGGSLKYDVAAATDLFVTFSAGYEAFLVKSSLTSLGAKSSSGFIPLKAGLKYYFSEGFFGEAQVGAAISTESGGGTAFAYAPGIGYSFDGGFEVGARYEGWSKNGTIGQAALRVAFSFK
jgi:hypothetical protein